MRYLLLLLIFLCGCQDSKPVPHQYKLGDKLLLKTGDVAVVVEYPWYNRQYDARCESIPLSMYTVRVALAKKLDHTNSLLDGPEIIQTDIGIFDVYEHEIERKIE